ncbi:cytotoxic translational repressor of toxin-antitoxin stability system [Geobacter sp.]|uniref:cytotoxic translational repressor of toxin-antitoxin stability system n=1 Tax=Geobacter sp. TaxID=46610 RepID=UPI002602A535|nr:cytotoxic translational repressor of toxin-antitoxin stability system [Geobacter sp.]
MEWIVRITGKVDKQARKLPRSIIDRLFLLMEEIRLSGPVRGNWPNYGKLRDGRHHCHLKKGKPTYVAVWEERDKEIRLIEVTYAGTHEKAPY